MVEDAEPRTAGFPSQRVDRCVLARCAAQALGRELTLVKRPPQFCAADLPRRVQAMGGLDVSHTHAWGPLAEPLRGADAVVGGYGSDVLVNGCYMRDVIRTHYAPERYLSDPSGPPGGVPRATLRARLQRPTAAASGRIPRLGGQLGHWTMIGVKAWWGVSGPAENAVRRLRGRKPVRPGPWSGERPTLWEHDQQLFAPTQRETLRSLLAAVLTPELEAAFYAEHPDRATKSARQRALQLPYLGGYSDRLDFA
jgi:hypothetical protein